MEKGIRPKIEKYLTKKAFLNKWNIRLENDAKFRYVIVIPALKELGTVKKLLKSLAANETKAPNEFLLIFVINNSEQAPAEIREENYETIEFLNASKRDFPIPIAVLDASRPSVAFPEKTAGVGFARKIGLDVALTVLDYEKNGRGLICLDADCTVSQNYLETIEKVFADSSFHAGYFRFVHPLPDNEENALAIINYEVFLHYYVAGLLFANSPYAFHTVGSTMIFDAESYVAVGGMNKRKAGEDFYFMEKLAKNYDIRFVGEATVFPSPRPSFRVPFGTGKRVQRFLSKERNEYLLYSPKSFHVLKEWNKVFLNEKSRSALFYMKEAHKISPALKTFLIENKFEESWESIRKNSNASEQISRQKKLWFDGFRTLKLIHYLQKHSYPDSPMFEAVSEIFSLLELEAESSFASVPPLSKQIKILKTLRESVFGEIEKG